MSDVFMGRRLSRLERSARRPEIETAEPEPPPELTVAIARRLGLSFDGRALGTTERVTLASAVDTSGWVSGTLVTVLHAKNAWLTGAGGNTTGQASVIAENTVLDPEAPDVAFVDPRVVATSMAIGATSTAPLLHVQALTRPFGPQLRVSIQFAQGSLQAASAQTLSISVYLVGRPA